MKIDFDKRLKFGVSPKNKSGYIVILKVDNLYKSLLIVSSDDNSPSNNTSNSTLSPINFVQNIFL